MWGEPATLRPDDPPEWAVAYARSCFRALTAALPLFFGTVTTLAVIISYAHAFFLYDWVFVFVNLIGRSFVAFFGMVALTWGLLWWLTGGPRGSDLVKTAVEHGPGWSKVQKRRCDMIAERWNIRSAWLSVVLAVFMYGKDRNLNWALCRD